MNADAYACCVRAAVKNNATCMLMNQIGW